MGIFELSVTWLSNNAQNKLKYVDVAQGINANKKSRSKLITFILFGLSLVYRCYPVSDQNYFLTIFDGDDLYSYWKLGFGMNKKIGAKKIFIINDVCTFVI